LAQLIVRLYNAEQSFISGVEKRFASCMQV